MLGIDRLPTNRASRQSSAAQSMNLVLHKWSSRINEIPRNRNMMLSHNKLQIKFKQIYWIEFTYNQPVSVNCDNKN